VLHKLQVCLCSFDALLTEAMHVLKLDEREMSKVKFYAVYPLGVVWGEGITFSY